MPRTQPKNDAPDKGTDLLTVELDDTWSVSTAGRSNCVVVYDLELDAAVGNTPLELLPTRL